MAEAKTFTSARVKGCLTSVIFIILMYQLWRFANYHDNTVSVERTEKPQGIPIIGVVFCDLVCSVVSGSLTDWYHRWPSRVRRRA